MMIFVTGGTGALGTPVVRLLRAHGHEVTATARTDRAAAALAVAGAEPVRVALSDRTGLIGAVRGADAILHLATRIPPSKQAMRRGAWAENDQIRTTGTRNLVDAALTSGVPALVYPSITLMYADGGANWLDFDAPVKPAAVMASTLTAEAEVDRFRAAGGRGVTLRLAGLYGPHSAATQDILGLARRGFSGLLGPAGAYQSLVWDEDAAAALVVAAESTVDGGFNIADDEPLTRADLAVALGDAVGRRVRRIPGLVRPLLGRPLDFMFRSQRVANRRFAGATGWAPKIHDAAAGFRRMIGK